MVSRSASLAPKLSLAPGKVSNKIVINVGGIRYETFRSTLKNLPDTRLAWVTSSSANNPDYDPSTGEYFFDRHPGVFNMILNYYRTGKLHAPTDVCGPLFEEELAFWGIDEKQIEPCCWPTYRAHRDAQETLADFDNDNEVDDENDDAADEEIARRFGIVNDTERTQKNWFTRMKPKIWTLLEEPESSPSAKVVTVVTAFFIILSVAIFCAETHSLFRQTKNNETIPDTATIRERQRLTQPYLFLRVLEYTCIVFFTLHVIVGFLFCPDKKEHILQGLTMVDILSILPFYIEHLVVLIDPDLTDSDGLYFLNSVRLIMIFRILRLTRHFSGFKILGHTLKASAKELLLMILVLVIGVLIFSCLIYYAEQVQEDSLNDFKNIPLGFWWAVVTMTTLGYGDVYPRTALGYIVGAVCALCGLLMLALPVPVIVNNFTLYYSHAQAKLKLPKKARNTLVGAADALKSSLSDSGSASGSINGSATSLEPLTSAATLTAANRSQGQGQTQAVKAVTTTTSQTRAEEDVKSDDSGCKTGTPGGEAQPSGISVIFTDMPPLDRGASPPLDLWDPTVTRTTSSTGIMDGDRGEIIITISNSNGMKRKKKKNLKEKKSQANAESKQSSLDNGTSLSNNPEPVTTTEPISNNSYQDHNANKTPQDNTNSNDNHYRQTKNGDKQESINNNNYVKEESGENTTAITSVKRGRRTSHNQGNGGTGRRVSLFPVNMADVDV